MAIRNPIDRLSRIAGRALRIAMKAILLDIAARRRFFEKINFLMGGPLWASGE